MDYTISFKMMGTIIDLKLTHPDAKALGALVRAQLQEYEQRFSANDVTSELVTINKAAGKQAISVDPMLFELISIGKEQSLASQGDLNIAIGPLVQLWRIGFSDAQVPGQLDIEKAQALIQPEDIELNPIDTQVFLRKSGMKLDLGCLAKGFIADKVLTTLQKAGVERVLLNLGGNIVVWGNTSHHKQGLWRIGIQNPQASRNQCRVLLEVQNCSVVTSGIYERVLEQNGQRYHHILDGKTGYPLEAHIQSLTIISKTSLEGEIWTTRLFGKRPEAILAEIEKYSGLECVIIDLEGEITYSKGIEHAITISMS